MDPTGPPTGEISPAGVLPDGAAAGSGAAPPAGAPPAGVGAVAGPATSRPQAKARAQASAAAGAAVTAPVTPKKRRNLKRLGIEWGIVIIVATVVAVCLRAFVVQAFFVPSGSMEPTLDVGDRILVIKNSFLAGPVGRGSIIVFKRPPDIPCEVEPGVSDLVKRVIALPGETIESVGQRILVDGKVLNEPGWFMPGLEVGDRPVVFTKVPPGDYYVMGDNRNNSCDSRYFGPIVASSVIGKVVMLVWRNGHPAFHFF